MSELKLPSDAARLFGVIFLAALVILLIFLTLGVVRRWRWEFWLLVVAFIAGIFRVPATILEMTGVLPSAGPGWYSIVQVVVGVIQFLIGLTLLRGYRRGGILGEF